MGSYANAVTEPLWESKMPEVTAYFREAGWAEHKGERGALAFCTTLRDSSDGGLSSQIFMVCLDLEKLLPIGFNLTIIWINELEEVQTMTAKDAKTEKEEYVKYIEQSKQGSSAERQSYTESTLELINPRLEHFLGDHYFEEDNAYGGDGGM